MGQSLCLPLSTRRNIKRLSKKAGDVAYSSVYKPVGFTKFSEDNNKEDLELPQASKLYPPLPKYEELDTGCSDELHCLPNSTIEEVNTMPGQLVKNVGNFNVETTPDGKTLVSINIIRGIDTSSITDAGQIATVDAATVDAATQDRLFVSFFDKGCTEESVAFCYDCSYKLCKGHKKIHDNWFSSLHTYIPFDEYCQNPSKYELVHCLVHKLPIEFACDRCDMPLCKECELAGKCPGHVGRRTVPCHRPKTLEFFQKIYSAKYLSDIEAICTRRELWRKCLNTAQPYVVEWRNFNAWSDISPLGVKRAVAYIHDLEEKIKDLTSVEEILRQRVQKCHVTDIIGKHIDDHQQVNRVLRMTIIDPYEIRMSRPMIDQMEDYLMKSMSADAIPIQQHVLSNPFSPDCKNSGAATSTRIIRSISVQKQLPLRSTAALQFPGITGNGELIMYRNNELVIADDDCNPKVTKSFANVIGVLERNFQIFVVRYVKGEMICEYFHRFFPQQVVEVCRFKTIYHETDTHPVTVDDQLKHIIFLERYPSGVCLLRVYTYKGYLSHIIKLDVAYPTGIWSAGDNSVIVSGLSTDGSPVLSKYNIAPGGMCLWSRRNVHSHGVAVDEFGLCYCLLVKRSTEYGNSRNTTSYSAYESRMRRCEMLILGFNGETQTALDVNYYFKKGDRHYFDIRNRLMLLGKHNFHPILYKVSE